MCRALVIVSFLVGLFSAEQTLAQCSFDLGNDTIICQGQSITFSAVPGMDSYLWNTGANSQSITVNTPGQYICATSLLTGTTNLIANSNFNQFNTGFTTDYTNNPGGQYGAVSPAGSYLVTFNSGNAHVNFSNCGDHNGGFFGMMLVANGSVAAGQNVWCQTVNVTPNTDYLLGFWVQTVFGTLPAELQVFMNGVPIGNSIVAPNVNCVWQQHATNWNSGNLTSVDFCIQNLELSEPDNDFALDDIFMYEQCYHLDTVNLQVQAYPTPNLGPDVQICPWDSLLLDITTPGATYQWNTGETSASIYAGPGAGNYSVTVDVNGCTGSDQIDISTYGIPDLDIGPDTTLCDGTPLVLGSNIAGATYQWNSNNIPSAVISVSQSGTYWLNATSFGCTQSDTIEVVFNPIPTVSLPANTAICDYDSILLDVTYPDATYLWSNGSSDSSIYGLPGVNYTVDVTALGCTGSGSINIAANTPPVIDLGADTTICATDNIVLNPGFPGGTYLWNTNAVTPSIQVSAAGQYDVAVTDGNGCISTDSIVVQNHFHAGVDLGPDVSICPGDTAVLSSSIPTTTYLWNSGETTNSIQATTQGWYWLDAEMNGCVLRDSIFLTVLPPTLVDLGPDTLVCADQQFTLDAFQNGASYLWSTGSTLSSVTALPDSTFSVAVTLNGCVGADTIVVASNPLPQIDLGADTAICPDASLLLSAAIPGGSYLWQDGSSGPTLLVSSGTIAHVEVSDANGCVGGDTISISAAPVPVADLGMDQTICPGDSAFIDASYPNASYIWSNGSLSATQWVQQAGDLSVTLDIGGCTSSDTVNISISSPPIVNLGNDTLLCPGTTLVLDAGVQAGTITWNDNSNGQNLQVSSSGTYFVDVVGPNGCVTSDTIEVNYVNASALNIGNDTTVCPGTQLSLTANLPGAVSYLWSDNTPFQSTTVNQAGTYWVEVVTSGCSISDTIVVSTFSVDSVNLGADTLICPGDSILIDASTLGGSSYAWGSGAAGAIQYLQPGFQSISVIDNNGCFSFDVMNIGSISVNPVNLGPDQSICAGDSVLLNGTTNGANAYSWNTTDTVPSIYATSAGQYILDVAQNSCVVSDTVQVSVVPIPQINLGANQTPCPGDIVVLDATWPGATYAWNNGSSLPNLSVNSSGTYSVLVDVNGCTDQDTVQITYALPFSVFVGNDTSLCPGQSLTLNSNQPSAINLWNGASISPSFVVNAPGTYWLDATIGTCTESDSITVSYVNVGALNLGPDTDFCEGDTVILDASGVPGAALTWQDGSSNTTFQAATTGTYWVEAGIAGCTISDTVLLTSYAYPIIDLGADTSLCADDSLILDAGGVIGLLSWSNLFVGTSQLVAPGQSIWLSANNNGCESSDTIAITSIPLPQLELGSDTILCAGESLALSATPGMNTYNWNTGSSANSIAITSPGQYAVEVTLNGCSSLDTIEVFYVQPGAVNLGPDSTICPGESIEVGVNLPGASYIWNTGVSSDSISVSSTGLYWVNATVSACSETDSIFITVEPVPVPDLGNDTLICETDTLLLNAQVNGVNVLWNTGDSVPVIAVNNAGNYSVLVEQNGCTLSDDINVSVQVLLDELDVGEEFLTCDGTPIAIDAFTAGASYLWSNGSTTASTTYNSQSDGWVELSGFCIQAVDSFVVNTEDCTPLVQVPNAFTPDGDGINDHFHWACWGDLQSIEVLIYNRWGELVFSSTDPQGLWDGTYNGSDAAIGVYVYRIVYWGVNVDGIVHEELNGHVSILR